MNTNFHGEMTVFILFGYGSIAQGQPVNGRRIIQTMPETWALFLST